MVARKHFLSFVGVGVAVAACAVGIAQTEKPKPREAAFVPKPFKYTIYLDDTHYMEWTFTYTPTNRMFPKGRETYRFSADAQSNTLWGPQQYCFAMKREASLQDTPISINAMSSRDIENSAITDIQDVVSSQPGLTLGSGAQKLDSQSVFLRGLGSARTLVLLNGRRMPIQPVPENLDAIEVLKDVSVVRQYGYREYNVGASYAIYGKDAVSGVVNLVTKSSNNNYATVGLPDNNFYMEGFQYNGRPLAQVTDQGNFQPITDFGNDNLNWTSSTGSSWELTNYNFDPAPVATDNTFNNYVNGSLNAGIGLKFLGAGLNNNYSQYLDHTWELDDKWSFNAGIRYEGIDMNSMSLSFNNPFSAPVEYTIGAGLTFASGDSGTQNMISTEELKVKLAAHQSSSIQIEPVVVHSMEELYAQIGRIGGGKPTSQDKADSPSKKKTIRVMCLQKDKQPPRPGSPFTAMRTDDINLEALCAAMKKDAIQGGAEQQARIWIYTDQATFDSIGERLGLPPSRGQYVKALWDVDQLTNVDLTQGVYARCLEPRLVICPGAPSQAVDWFVKTLTRTNPEGLLAFLRSDQSFVQKLGSKPKDYDYRHAAYLGNALCQSDNPRVQMAGLDFLASVPESARKRVLMNKGMSGVSVALLSDDPEVAMDAVEVVGLYGYKGALIYVQSLALNGSDAALKNKAGVVAAKLRSAS